MPSPQVVYANFASGAVSAGTATETVFATTRSVSSPAAGTLFLVRCTAVYIPGTGTTSVIINARRTSLTGTQVYGAPGITVAAGNEILVSAAFIDTLVGDVASAVWVWTVTQNGGTGAGSVSNACTEVVLPI